VLIDHLLGELREIPSTSAIMVVVRQAD